MKLKKEYETQEIRKYNRISTINNMKNQEINGNKQGNEDKRTEKSEAVAQNSQRR